MAEVTRGAWAKRFCNHRDLSATTHRLRAIVAWESAENTAARWNPLATTWDLPNDSLYNSTGVRNYAHLQDGVKASWLTLLRGDASYNYAAIVRALDDNAPAREILEAVAASAWGTGALALTILPYLHDEDVYRRYASKLIGQ